MAMPICSSMICPAYDGTNRKRFMTTPTRKPTPSSSISRTANSISVTGMGSTSPVYMPLAVTASTSVKPALKVLGTLLRPKKGVNSIKPAMRTVMYRNSVSLSQSSMALPLHQLEQLQGKVLKVRHHPAAPYYKEQHNNYQL